MSVTEISQLHTRYVRLSEKFKALWTYNQFAAGVYKNLLQLPLPYKIDFQAMYESLRKACDVIQSSTAPSAGPMMDRNDRELQQVIRQLIEADELITASILRRFFEKIRRQDEKIIYNMIKFYMYAESVVGDQRDKLDFLFTQIAQDFIEERGEYSVKDSLELRKLFQSLVVVRPVPAPNQQDIIRLIRNVRTLRDEIGRASSFEDLTNTNLLARARSLKHTIGDQLFHPDVLLAIVDCNVTTKNRFIQLYRDEEQHLIDDARRLLENEQAIARGFGKTNPELLEEMERFKQYKQAFDDSRANSNVKHNVIAQLKSSMNNILAQLDKGLDGAEPEDLSDSFFLEVQHSDAVQSKFGNDPVLYDYLVKVISVLDSFDRDTPQQSVAGAAPVRGLRLEGWEVSAFQKLYWAAQRAAGETDDLLLLYLRAAALRLKIEDEAKALAAAPANKPLETGLMERIKSSLDKAKDLDVMFKDSLQEGLPVASPRNLHRLYRSRLRLLRGFSGLWLVYDARAGGQN